MQLEQVRHAFAPGKEKAMLLDAINGASVSQAA